jgi:hypothetical protein
LKRMNQALRNFHDGSGGLRCACDGTLQLPKETMRQGQGPKPRDLTFWQALHIPTGQFLTGTWLAEKSVDLHSVCLASPSPRRFWEAGVSASLALP